MQSHTTRPQLPTVSLPQAFKRSWPLAVLLALSCQPEDRQRAEPKPEAVIPPFNDSTRPIDSTEPAPVLSPPRPPSMRIGISIEGMTDTITARLVRAPASFSVPFSTYVPEEMDAGFDRSTEGETFRVTAEFGGVRNEKAYLEVLLYPEGIADARVQDHVRAFVAGRDSTGDSTRQVDRFSWADEEYSFRYPDPNGSGNLIIGYAAIGRHGNRFFHLIIHYPAEYGDGMPPRTGVMIEQWRWEDPGRGLAEDVDTADYVLDWALAYQRQPATATRELFIQALPTA